MPKPITERKTSNPLGMKINAVMREKGIEGNYGVLAAIFEVKPPSVYDWITHGRLGKERYAKLVEWSGKSLDWWFDIATPAQHHYATSETAHTPLQASDVVIHLDVTPPAKASPFDRISHQEWASLPPGVVREIETYALGLIAGMKIAPDLKRRNGA